MEQHILELLLVVLELIQQLHLMITKQEHVQIMTQDLDHGM